MRAIVFQFVPSGPAGRAETRHPFMKGKTSAIWSARALPLKQLKQASRILKFR